MERFLKSKYKIGTKIGENPHTATYEGSFLGSGQPVIIKIYKRAALNNALIKKLRNKVKILEKIEHPGIAKLYDGDYGWQGFYYVREFINSRNLSNIIKSKGIFSFEETLKIAEKLSDALETIHSRQLIHGALSPNNIFIDAKKGEIKITDLIIEGTIKDSIPQKAAQLFDKAAYITPEEIFGLSPQKESDIYSFALILLEMLIGNYPFSPNGKKEGLSIVSAKLNRDLISLSKTNQNLPSIIEEIFAKALANDPILRFKNTKDFISSLKNRSIETHQQLADSLQINYNNRKEESEINSEDKETEEAPGNIKEALSSQHNTWYIKILILITLAAAGYAALQLLVR